MTDHEFVKAWDDAPLIASSLKLDRCEHCGNFQVILFPSDGKTPFAVGEFSPADAFTFARWIAESLREPQEAKTVN